jgi:hypothetical protein
MSRCIMHEVDQLDDAGWTELVDDPTPDGEPIAAADEPDAVAELWGLDDPGSL